MSSIHVRRENSYNKLEFYGDRGEGAQLKYYPEKYSTKSLEEVYLCLSFFFANFW